MDKHSLKSKDLNEILNFLKQICQRYFHIECCAIIGKNKNYFVAEFMQNRSPEPNSFFCVDPIDFLRFQNQNELICIFHSHQEGDESFSDLDIANAEALCVPSMVYSLKTDKFAFYEPKECEVNVKILKKVKKYL
jgi:proteasome lid subunit RPN8/RPN11